MTWPVIKAAFGRIEIIFHHKEEIQTRANRKCCNLKSWLSKILNSRTIPEQAWKKGIFSSSFPVPKKIQNNLRNSTIGNLETLCVKFDASPWLFFAPSPTKGSPLVILKIPQPPPPIKANLKSSNPPVSIGGSHYAVIATFRWYLIPLSSYHSVPTFANSNMLPSFIVLPHMIF